MIIFENPLYSIFNFGIIFSGRLFGCLFAQRSLSRTQRRTVSSLYLQYGAQTLYIRLCYSRTEA